MLKYSNTLLAAVIGVSSLSGALADEGIAHVSDQVVSGPYEAGGCPVECEDGGRSCLGWPDRGWNPPATTPVQRGAVVYRRMWPEYWYGQNRPAMTAPPVIHQPTDTMQMGFYYHRVPMWRPNPSMIPPLPNPAMYHSRHCPLGVPCGPIVTGRVVTPSPTPVTTPPAPSGPQPPAPRPAPEPPKTALFPVYFGGAR